MAVVMKLRKIGGSVEVIIPKDELERLHVKEGDVLYGIADGDGLPSLQAFDLAFERMRKRYRSALRELGK